MHDAFISYSRKDVDFTRLLEKALKEYAPPKDLKVPQRHLDIFRDEADFTGAEYHRAVGRHLSESAKLIVVCSPHARVSPYVADEIRHFVQTCGADNVISVLLSGIPNNEAKPGQEEEYAFPDSLVEALPMPLAKPYRGFDPRKDRVDRGPFSGAWHSLLADLYGVSRAEIEQREARRQARRRRITIGIVGSIIVMLSLALGISLVFWREAVSQRQIAQMSAKAEKEAREKEQAARIAEEEQRKVAEGQRALAIEREKIAVSRQLAAQALSEMQTRLDLALLLAIESTRTVSTAEARSSLVKTLQSAPGLRNFLHGHTGPVTRLAFSPDGKTIASGGADNTVRLWSVEGRALLDTPLYTHTRRSNGSQEIRAIAFSPNGSVVASGSLEGTLRFGDVKELKSHGKEITFGGTINTIAFTPDSRQAAIGHVGPAGFSLFDVDTLKNVNISLLPSQLNNTSADVLAFSPDGKLIAAQGEPGLFLFDSTTHKPISPALAERFPSIETMAFSRDGRLLACGDRDGTLRLWNVETQRTVGEPLRGEGIVLAVSFSEDGKQVAWARSDGSVHNWNITNWRAAAPPFFVGALSSAAFSPDNRLLALGDTRGKIRIWDNQSNQRHPLGESVSTVDWLDGVVFSPDGKFLGTGGDYLNLWDAASQKILRRYNDYKILSLAFSRNGRTMFTAGEQGVRIWDLTTNQAFSIPSEEKEPYNWSVAATPNGKIVAFGGKRLTLWDVAGRKPLPFSATIKGSIRAVAISPDGRLLAAGGDDKNIRLWKLPTGVPLGNPLPFGEEVWSLAFNRDGRILASGGDDGKLQLWDTQSFRPIGDPLPGHSSRVRSIAFSPDGTLMASGAFGRTLIIFDVATRQSLGDPVFIPAEYEVVSGIAFSPDGKLLAVSERRQKLYFLDGGEEAWKARACRIAKRNLTAEEWRRYVGNEPYRKTCASL